MASCLHSVLLCGLNRNVCLYVHIAQREIVKRYLNTTSITGLPVTNGKGSVGGSWSGSTVIPKRTHTTGSNHKILLFQEQKKQRTNQRKGQQPYEITLTIRSINAARKRHTDEINNKKARLPRLAEGFILLQLY